MQLIYAHISIELWLFGTSDIFMDRNKNFNIICHEMIRFPYLLIYYEGHLKTSISVVSY